MLKCSYIKHGCFSVWPYQEPVSIDIVVHLVNRKVLQFPGVCGGVVCAA